EVRGCESVPRTKADDREPGPPPRVVCAVGWQYRAIFEGGATQPARGPQRGSRVGVGRGCIARRTGSPTRQPRWGPRMQPDFHYGLPGQARFDSAGAARLAREMYGLDASASALPSERDQNFLLATSAGRYVLKIPNAAEHRAVLEAPNAAMAHV